MSGLRKATGFVDRGDNAAWDITTGDITADGNYNNWDISGVIDSDAKAVLIAGTIKDGVAGLVVKLREDGNSNDRNASELRTQVANVNMSSDAIIPVGPSGILEINAAPTTWSTIAFSVKGWWR